ncbi:MULTISPECIES: hypothetical protein [Flavobacterium]|uniref:Uncharacterized protein n=2 Tax=Flavobacterium TaxID=237 RepID=G8XA63_FLACA|nr:hypothetical protein [Flavobacterium columnare]AEW85921.1 hypothetical protein FCOL_05480 [Flavobacterium columnare ATCC 49512]
MESIINAPIEEVFNFFKNQYPTTWDQKINEGKEAIANMIRLYHLPAVEAVQKAMETSGNFTEPLVVLSALFVIMRTQRINNEIEQIISQEIKLETSDKFSSREANELRLIYSEKKKILQQELQGFLAEIPVITNNNKLN